MIKDYILYKVLYKGRDVYILSFDNAMDQSEFLKNEDDTVRFFKDMDSFAMFCSDSNLKIYEPITFNLNEFLYELKNLKAHKLYGSKICDCLLLGWNFIEEYMYTKNQKTDHYYDNVDSVNICYDKLVLGTNIPSLMTSEEEYHPVWSQREVFVIRSYMLKLLHEFTSEMF
ncbi:MAG: hypothetical protein ACRBDL_03340 [Alphaproteobacteria bacterium]